MVVLELEKAKEEKEMMGGQVKEVEGTVVFVVMVETIWEENLRMAETLEVKG